MRRALWIATGALGLLAAGLAAVWLTRPGPGARGWAVEDSDRWDLAWPEDPRFRRLPERFDLSALVTLPSGGEPAVRLLVNAVQDLASPSATPGQSIQGWAGSRRSRRTVLAEWVARAAYVDVTPSRVTVGRIEGELAVPAGSGAVELARDRPHEVIVKRRGEVLAVAVDGRLAIQAVEPHLHGGGVAVGVAGGARSPLRPVRRLPELPEFADDFMRTPEEPSPWEVYSGKWEIESIAVPSMSANAFSYRGRSGGAGKGESKGKDGGKTERKNAGKGESGVERVFEPGRVALAAVGNPNWDRYRAEVSVRGEKGGRVGLAFAGRFGSSGRRNRRYALFRWSAGGPTGGRKKDERELVLVEGDAETVVATAPGGYDPGQWYRIAVELDFGRARVLVDGHEVFNEERPEFVSGGVGLWCAGAKGATFDDALVMPSRSVELRFRPSGLRSRGCFGGVGSQPGLLRRSRLGSGGEDEREGPAAWRARWQAVGGEWTLGAGAVVVRAPGDGRGGAKLLTGSPSWRRLAVEAELDDNGSRPAGAGVVVDYRDERDYVVFRLDRSRLGRSAGTGGPGGTDCVLERVLDGKARALDRAALAESAPAAAGGGPRGTTLRVESEDGLIAGYVNGRRLVEAFDESSTGGRGGLWSSAAGECAFRRFRAGFMPHRPPVSMFNVVFETDRLMADWADESADWYSVGETSGSRRVHWHQAPFHGDVELSVDVPPVETPRGDERLVLGIKKSGVRKRNGYGWSLEHAKPSAAAEGEGRRPTGEWTCRLVREGETVRETALESGFAVESLFVRKRGRHIIAGANGETLTVYRDDEPLEDARVAVLADGFPFKPGRDARVRGGRVFDWVFNEAPVGWRVAAGEWSVGNRWKCDPRWSFLVGKPVNWPGSKDDEKLVAIWNKRSFPGDVTVDFFIGPRMDWTERWRRYEYVRDFNVTVSADGRDISSGYTFMFGGFGNTRSAILRGGEVLAEAAGGKAVYPARSMIGHQRWFHIRAERRGGKLRYRVYFNSAEMVALDVEDPEPLEGDRVAVWSYDCPVVIARMRIAGSDASGGGTEYPAVRPPGRVRTPYDTGRPDTGED